MISNDDMIYPPGWFEDLTMGMEDKICVSPQLVEPRQGAPTFEVYPCGGAGGDFDKQRFFDWYAKRSTDGFRMGFNMPVLMTRELWDLVGGYDINYDPWGSNSDSDLEYKIKVAGVQPYQNRNCNVYHFGQTSGTFESQNREAWQKNWDYFIKKWGFPRTDDGIWQANFEIPKENKYHPWYEGHYAN
jgi:GT2 family glycosyltransferase